MEEPAPRPEESTKAKWSEATGQAILLAAFAWALFTSTQASWYMTTFQVEPLRVEWVAVTLLAGALPPLAVLLFIFLVSWLVGAVRGRADPWRSYRDGLVVAGVFTLLFNVAIWLSQSQ